jgi:hypothetical protein
MNIEKFFIELGMAPYVGDGVKEEQAILALAQKHGIEEGIALPVKGAAAIKKYTEVKFVDGIKFIQNIKLLSVDIDKLDKNLFLTKSERNYLVDNNIANINDLIQSSGRLNIAIFSAKLYAKLFPYINGIYIRNSYGRIVSGACIMNLPKDKAYIIRNPNGTQDSPDFVLLWNGKCLPLELKTSKVGKILWNSGHHAEGYLYSFVCPLLDRHWFYMGEDYSSAETRMKLVLMREKLDQLVMELNTELKINSNVDEYTDLYVRPMHNARPYYSSPNRIRNHNKVIDKLLEFSTNISPLKVEA